MFEIHRADFVSTFIFWMSYISMICDITNLEPIIVQYATYTSLM